MFDIIDNKSTVCRYADFKTFNFEFSAIENLFQCVKAVVFIAAFVLLSVCSLLADEASNPFSENGSKAGDRAVKVVNGVEFAFRWCPPGTFMMGSPESEDGRKKDETQHQVTLTKGFWMMETEVSLGQWKAIMGNNPSQWDVNNDDNKPVQNVSWNDCQSFCQNSLKYGLPIELPTEAQWEYACRAGTTDAFAGDIEKMAWTRGGGFELINPTGMKTPNKWGLYDMYGNVCELCSDWYASYPHQSVTDPKGPSSGTHRVMRGGCIKTEHKYCRSANRGKCLSDYKNEFIGFRCVIGKGVSVIYSPIKSSAKPKTNVTRIEKFGQGTKAGERKTAYISGVEFAFRWCPPGAFIMGSPESEKGRREYETEHQVTLTKGFWMLETEVTQEQWNVVMGNNPSYFKGDKFPVECVRWTNCRDFCMKCKELGLPAALPTEAQWEYACRAGTTGAYAGVLEEIAWYWDNSGNRTHPAGKKKSNPWGLFDMHGNVLELCQDWYGDYSDASVTDPAGPTDGSYKVVRGGSWDRDERESRSASRGCYGFNDRFNYMGFRCVLSDDSQSDSSDDSDFVLIHKHAESEGQNKNDDNRKAGTREVVTVNGAEFAFRWCPPGTFTMGSPVSEEGREVDEVQHQVTLTKGFWMLETEVTQKQWEAIMGNNPSHSRGGDLPVEQVSWFECIGFCSKCKTLGFPVQLPTEVQWEYACRAGSTTAYSWGDALNGDKANCDGRYPCGTKILGPNLNRIMPVRSYDPNAWGLYDMHGNVCEWTRDYYAAYPRGSVTDPIAPSDGRSRVSRDGGWDWGCWACRSASRFGINPVHQAKDRGLRLMLLKISPEE